MDLGAIQLGGMSLGSAQSLVASSIYDLSATPVARYLLNEATSGQVPTQAVDDTGNSNTLALSFAGGTGVAEYSSDVGGTGIAFKDVAGGSSGSHGKLSDLSANGTLGTLTGKDKLTIVLAVEYEADSGSSNGARIFQIGTDTGDGELALYSTTTDLKLRWNKGVGASAGGEVVYTPPSVGKVIITIEIDTTQAVSADRCKMYYDDVLQVATSIPEVIVQNSTLDSVAGATQSLTVGNRGDGDRTWKGVIRYLEFLDGTLSTAEKTLAFSELDANDDSDWKTTGSHTGTGSLIPAAAVLGGTGTTTSAAGYDLGAVPLVRYYFDEATTGRPVTDVFDSAGSNDLTLDYDGTNAEYTNNAVGSGLQFTGALHTTTAVASLSLPSGNALATSLIGETGVSFLAIIENPVGHSDGSRVFQIGRASGADGNIGLLLTNTALRVRWNQEDFDSNYFSNFPIPSSGAVICVRIDTTLATAADRIRVSFDGVDQTSTGSTLPPQNDTLHDFEIDSPGTTLLTLGNRGGGSRNFQGTLKYFELFKGLLSPTECTTAATALALDDDANWKLASADKTATGDLTPVVATLSGTVEAIGNVDATGSLTPPVAVLSGAGLAYFVPVAGSTEVFGPNLTHTTEEVYGPNYLVTVNAATGALSSPVAILNAVSVKGSVGTSSLTAVVATLQGAGVRQSNAIPALVVPVAVLNGSGTAILEVSANGGMVTSVAVVNGTAARGSPGIGALTPVAAVLGQGVTGSIVAPAALTTNVAVLQGVSVTGVVASAAALIPIEATLNSTGIRTSVGVSQLVPTVATLSGVSVVSSVGTGSLVPSSAVLDGNGIRGSISPTNDLATTAALLGTVDITTPGNYNALGAFSTVATLTGNGFRGSTSDSALVPIAAVLDGGGVRTSYATSSLQPVVATLDDVGVIGHPATGDLTPPEATLQGVAVRGSVSGVNGLVPSVSVLSGLGFRNSVIAASSLVPELAILNGTVDSSNVASGNLTSVVATVTGVSVRSSTAISSLTLPTATLNGVGVKSSISTGSLTPNVSVLSGTVGIVGNVNLTVSGDLTPVSPILIGVASKNNNVDGSLTALVSTLLGTGLSSAPGTGLGSLQAAVAILEGKDTFPYIDGAGSSMVTVTKLSPTPSTSGGYASNLVRVLRP